MSTSTPIRCERGGLQITAVVNGRVRADVCLKMRGTGQTLALEEINLSRGDERSRFASQLPDHLRDDALALLLETAEAVAAHRATSGGKEGDAKNAPGVGVTDSVEPWPDEVDGARLLDDLGALLRQHMVLPEHADHIVALWTAHTYLLDCADFTPYLLVSSPVRECGKSTLLDLLVWLAYRAQQTGGYSAAVLYRRVDRVSPTLLLDELDARLTGDMGEAIRGVLNSGFHRNGKFSVCVGDEHEDKDFKTFCPKVLAGIRKAAAGWDTVTSRSVPIRLARASKAQLGRLKKIRGNTIGSICHPYRQRLVRWANDVREELLDVDPPVPDELGARQSDVLRPLLAIADMAGGHWPETARTSMLGIFGVTEEEADVGLLLLADLRDLFRQSGAERMHTAHVIEELTKREDRPWPEWKHGKPITAVQLAKLAGRFGIKSKTLRSGPVNGKGYELAALAPIFEQYLPAERSAAVTDAQPITQPVTEVSSSSSSVLGEGVTGVTGLRGDGPDTEDGRPVGAGEAWEAAELAPPDESQMLLMESEA